MWIESENGTLYSTRWMQSIRMEHTTDGWAIKAQFALPNPPSNNARPPFVTTTLKKFDYEEEAETAFETLKARLEDIVSFD